VLKLVLAPTVVTQQDFFVAMKDGQRIGESRRTVTRKRREIVLCQPFELRRSCSSWFQHYTVSVSICTQDDVQTVCRDPTYSAVGRDEDLQHSAIQLVLRESKAHRARRDVSQEMSGTFSRFDEGLDSRVKSVRIRTNVAGSAARGRQERTDEIHVGLRPWWSTMTLNIEKDCVSRPCGHRNISSPTTIPTMHIAIRAYDVLSVTLMTSRRRLRLFMILMLAVPFDL
jgi:hypothetical protein